MRALLLILVAACAVAACAKEPTTAIAVHCQRDAHVTGWPLVQRTPTELFAGNALSGDFIGVSGKLEGSRLCELEHPNACVTIDWRLVGREDASCDGQLVVTHGEYVRDRRTKQERYIVHRLDVDSKFPEYEPAPRSEVDHCSGGTIGLPESATMRIADLQTVSVLPERVRIRARLSLQHFEAHTVYDASGGMSFQSDSAAESCEGVLLDMEGRIRNAPLQSGGTERTFVLEAVRRVY